MTAARLRLAAQIAAVVIVAALLGLLGWKLTRGESEVTSQLDRGGSPAAPAFTLERLDGKGELALASLRGKAVVLNFWASWCGPCKDETPLLQEALRSAGRTRASSSSASTSRTSAATPGTFSPATASPTRTSTTARARRSGATASPASRRRTSSTPSGKSRTRIAGPVEDAAEIDAGDRARARAGVRLVALALAALALAGPAAASERASDRGRARVRARLPGLRVDARHVERAGRAADEGVHPRADRRRRHEERDQGRARRPVRPERARRAAEAAASSWSRGCCRSPGSRSASSSSACSPGAGAAGAASDEPPDARQPLDPALERRLDDELARFEP